jgi:molybdopterin-guanine dinucleotide biosynthesis protein A
MMVNNISGVILAGGANKRFGGIIKANIVIEGVTIISRIISVIGNLFPEILIVADDPEEFREFIQCKLIADHHRKAGPLGGIHAALKSASNNTIFVFAADMPFPDKKIITDQINEFKKGKYDVLIPKIGQLIEPLHGIYSKSLLNDLESFLSERKSKAVRDFLNKVNVGYLQIPDTDQNKKVFININSPSDLHNITF